MREGCYKIIRNVINVLLCKKRNLEIKICRSHFINKNYLFLLSYLRLAHDSTVRFEQELLELNLSALTTAPFSKQSGDEILQEDAIKWVGQT